MAARPARPHKKSITEEIQVAGHELVDRVKGLLEEGRVRHIRVKSPTGELYFELPLAVGMIGGAALAFASPWLAMAGSLAGIAASVKVEVVRENDEVIAVVEPLIQQAKTGKRAMHMEGGVNPGSLAMTRQAGTGVRTVAARKPAAKKAAPRTAAKKAPARKPPARPKRTAATSRTTAPKTAARKKTTGRR
jgi:hypothetical protein